LDAGEGERLGAENKANICRRRKGRFVGVTERPRQETPKNHREARKEQPKAEEKTFIGEGPSVGR